MGQFLSTVCPEQIVLRGLRSHKPAATRPAKQRRLLINYRRDPAVAETLLPSGLRPQLVDGSAVARICLLRLGAMRPAVFNRPGRTPRIGWSPTRNGLGLQGLRLATDSWRVDAGQVLEVQSSFFDALPAGSARLDSVLVMRNVPITWSAPEQFHGRGPVGV